MWERGAHQSRAATAGISGHDSGRHLEERRRGRGGAGAATRGASWAFLQQVGTLLPPCAVFRLPPHFIHFLDRTNTPRDLGKPLLSVWCTGCHVPQEAAERRSRKPFEELNSVVAPVLNWGLLHSAACSFLKSDGLVTCQFPRMDCLLRQDVREE